MGHYRAGQEHTAKVIGLNGISTYGGMALAAPLGVDARSAMGPEVDRRADHPDRRGELRHRLAQAPVAVEPGEHMPFAHVLGRVAPHGMGLALGGVSYSVLATFVTLFYATATGAARRCA